MIKADMSDARDVGIINVPLQGIHPGKGLQTTPNHQPTETSRERLDDPDRQPRARDRRV